ncbi:MAG: DUF4426 domain-containing protein [Pseudomonadota bacterium]|nr:DUF4426 domain-containing protein [Pseudomonadota bacterium]
MTDQRHSFIGARLALAGAVGLFAGLTGLATDAQAQAHEVRQGDYVLRSSTVASQSIAPETAAQHGIVPAPGRAVLNVVLLRPGNPSTAEATVAAEVSASRQNLAGVQQTIAMREVRANGYISYVGSYDFLPREVIDFTITARPAGAPPGQAVTLNYRDRMARR